MRVFGVSVNTPWPVVIETGNGTTWADDADAAAPGAAAAAAPGVTAERLRARAEAKIAMRLSEAMGRSSDYPDRWTRPSQQVPPPKSPQRPHVKRPTSQDFPSVQAHPWVEHGVHQINREVRQDRKSDV